MVAKASNLTYSVNINSSSLDQVIATFLVASYNTNKPLLLAGAGHETTGNIFNEVQGSAPIEDAGSVATSGDLFNQSIYFRRDGMGLTGSQFEINNVMMNPKALSLTEIYNETLIAMGNANIDISSGVHPGLQSSVAFSKYYFAHVLSLENLSNDGSFYRSGLDGRAAPLNIQWKTNFSVTENVTPMIFAAVTKVLEVYEGSQLNVVS